MTSAVGRRGLLLSAALAATGGGLPCRSFAQGAATTPRPVRIGVMSDMGGPYSATGGFGSVVGAQLAADDFGRMIGDHPIEVLSADHQNKPEVATSIARQWLDVRGVDVIADGGSSPCSVAIQQACREREKTFIISAAASGGFTGADCSKYGLHFTYDSYSLSSSIAQALAEQKAKTWFFIVADYVFGTDVLSIAGDQIKRAGGTVLGSVKLPLGTADFSSALLQAQSSGADVVMLANAGTDTQNAIKQAAEFGITPRQRLGTVLMFITDVVALGREVAGGLSFATIFYWDLDDKTREWTKRFRAVKDSLPTAVHAATYSGVRHFLIAARSVGVDSGGKIINDKMRATLVSDMLNDGVAIRADGQVLCNNYLVQVKKPPEARFPDDYYKILGTIPGDRAFRPLSEGKCPLVPA